MADERTNLNEFEQQEIDSATEVIGQKKEAIKGRIFDRLYGEDQGGEGDPVQSSSYKMLVSRIEDVENASIQVDKALVPLSTSDDLEAVKGRVNQIIEILNNSRV